MPRSQADQSDVLAQNRQHYELLVWMAQRYAAVGDVEKVLRTAMLAGNYALWLPVGLLSDLRLERIVVSAVRGTGAVTVDGDRRNGRVLHVLSEAHGIGGHTRLAARWIGRDERTADVVLTNQSVPVPGLLIDAARTSGGALHDLRGAGQGLLDRARALREHMDRADVVVLHVHAYDVVALAAANLPGPRPPVIYEQHADLTYWLGVAAADVLCELRPAVRSLDVDLRRVPAERIAVLPMPVDEMGSAGSEDLRRRLGIRPDAVVALTVSDDWKVTSTAGRGLHDLVDKVLHFSSRLTMVLVGVQPNPAWERLARKYPGRVHSVGRVPDPSPYFALADVYLESYPTYAGTTALEAALRGLPVVGLADAADDDPAHLFQRWSPGLAGRPAAPTPSRLALTVSRLAADADLRRRDGEEAAVSVRALHDNPGWRIQLEALYARARSARAADVGDLGESPIDERYALLLLRTFTASQASVDPRAVVAPLGDLYDSALEGDLNAALLRGRESSLQVRVAAGWADHPAWTARLLALAAAQPRLRVSMPFVAADDALGTASVTRLTELIAGVGRTTEDCGDICLESQAAHAPLSLNGELAFTDEALVGLGHMIDSPMWGDVPASAQEPVAVAG
ncbi:glycosyltransferase [Blastococcus goldschmidtiae]|uniref:Glycosyltransferase n=1 Tax=Blastococcus goldschmidtiae TaxID=3075546 RepID=A0ABU2KDY8_9ACTN|nr:glycosyltransferase [Blastococcus sp. DSM 46792]MDT0278403.1 glycosyltransferase [Blastococcus sp. DSM 46792]